jgi:DNA-binding NtrC family response regulator
MTIDEIERQVILRRLERFGYNRTHTAASLGICIRTIRNKIARYRSEGIDIP